MTIPAVFFGVIGIAIGWYAWQGIAAGKTLFGIRIIQRTFPSSSIETWFVRRQDPVSFWIAITLVVFMSLGALAVALGSI